MYAAQRIMRWGIVDKCLVYGVVVKLWSGLRGLWAGCGKALCTWEKISALMSCEKWWEALLFHELSMASGELSMAFP